MSFLNTFNDFDMRKLNVFECRNIDFLEACGLSHAEVCLTTNILKHAIFDATSSVKKVLKEGGVHDFSTQMPGVENKLPRSIAPVAVAMPACGSVARSTPCASPMTSIPSSPSMPSSMLSISPASTSANAFHRLLITR